MWPFGGNATFPGMGQWSLETWIFWGLAAAPSLLLGTLAASRDRSIFLWMLLPFVGTLLAVLVLELLATPAFVLAGLAGFGRDILLIFKGAVCAPIVVFIGLFLLWRAPPALPAEDRRRPLDQPSLGPDTICFVEDVPASLQPLAPAGARLLLDALPGPLSRVRVRAASGERIGEIKGFQGNPVYALRDQRRKVLATVVSWEPGEVSERGGMKVKIVVRPWADGDPIGDGSPAAVEPAAGPPAAPDSRGVADQIERLAALRAAGSLSEEEFRAAKSKVLGT